MSRLFSMRQHMMSCMCIHSHMIVYIYDANHTPYTRECVCKWDFHPPNHPLQSLHHPKRYVLTYQTKTPACRLASCLSPCHRIYLLSLRRVICPTPKALPALVSSPSRGFRTHVLITLCAPIPDCPDSCYPITQISINESVTVSCLSL